ncbi:MAG TPA: hypothetical protein VHW00_04685 [Thermoanaerobaculia bacterium]|nr:hypothetical protein [Thermoanaerobaculia bacterium]
MRTAVSTFLLILLLAVSASAATFGRVTDRDLLDRADLVVVATVVDSNAHATRDRMVWTDHRLQIEDVLKGSAPAEITVRELGGFADGIGVTVSGAPQYSAGERLVAFLRKNADGTFTTAYMALGEFRFARMQNGREVLVRDTTEIEAEDEESLAARPAGEFIASIRRGTPETVPALTAEELSRPLTPVTHAAASTYVIRGTPPAQNLPIRWEGCEKSSPLCPVISFTTNGPQTGTADTPLAINHAFDAWEDDPNSYVRLQLAGLNNDTSADNDDINDLIFNGTGTLGYCDGTTACSVGFYGPTHTYESETWYSMVSADVVIKPNTYNSQSVLDAVLGHEVGHALAFQHGPSGSLMASPTPTNQGATLRAWDKEALAEVYGAGLPCQNVAVTGTSGGGNVPSGGSKTLSVSVSGTSPFTYQWYEGASGNTSTPVGTSSTYTATNVTTTRNYWVRVSNTCPSSADSPTITLTPQACDQPNIVTQPQSVQITSGSSTTLTVQAIGDAPLSYKWYRGNVGDTSTQVGTGTSYTTPALTQTTSYWVQVSNNCGTKNSNLATVTVGACNAVSITTQPANANIPLNETTILSVVAAGTSPFTYQWYMGDSGNESQPIGGATSSSYSAGPYATAGVFKFWVKVSNSCGAPVNSTTATVTAATCAPVTIVQQATNVNLPIGQGATLNVTAAGTGPFTYQWYQGEAGNESAPIGGATNSSLPVGPFAAAGVSKYWVKVSNSCLGTPTTVNSLTIIVTVACAEASVPKIAAPAASHFSLAYDVSWTGDLGVTSTFELQEATNSNFTENVTNYTVTGAKQKTIPAHFAIGTDTRFYYRVRGLNACTGVPTAYSTTTSTIVTRPQPETSSSFSISVPESSTQSFTQNMLVPGFGDTATNGDTFAITIDVPWITVFPATGALSAGGTTVQLTVDPTPLDVGTTTGTITVQRTQPASSKFTTNGTTSATLPFSVSLVTPVTPTPRGAAPPGTMIIPAVAHADGIGTRFQSDVRIVNTSNDEIEYELSFTPSGQNGTQTGKQTTVKIASNDVMSFDDIVKAWYGAGVLGEFGVGTIEIRPLNGANPLATFASSRTYAVEQRGTYGQFIPAIPLEKFIGSFNADSLSKISLQQVANSAAYRTNIGLVEGSGAGANAIIKLFDGNNNLLQSVERSLQPYGHEQLAFSQLFGNVTVDDGRIEVTVNSENGKASAYASVIDNATSDPLLVFPEQALRSVAKHYVVPGVAELENGVASNFHTDMRVFNAGEQPVTLTLNYYPQSGDATARPAAVQRLLEPGKVTAIDNVLPSLWSLSRTGGAVTIDASADASIVVTARTYSRDENNGTYGQFIPGVTSKDAVGAGERALQVLQLEQSEQYRTNLGLVEVTGQPARIEITAQKPDTKTTAVTAYDLKPNEFIQFGRIFQSMGLPTVYGGRISVKVLEGTGRVAAYGSVVDNRTVDPTYVPAQ